ncbi:3-oxo-5-alpha-steroid 4-dehydrogenase 2 isoform X2 [Amia ocellicauda]|uniref:3-oxo-5-alpha-steroid 4-dehydrogenase 2 isoform X2 n=1 Tax=Amia ocellicauda TaxID=2972642 RepID=UPI0034645C7D
MLSCKALSVTYSCMLTAGAVVLSYRQRSRQTPYGRYVRHFGAWKPVPAKLAWLVQELPSFFVPLLLWATAGETSVIGRTLLLALFCGHYFQRSFIYALLTKGRPSPFFIVVSAVIFCTVNGLFQGSYMLFCAQYDEAWLTDIRLILGLTLFFLGMAINIHSDHILRNLRQTGEVVYKIPRGGLFEYVSGANFFGEIIEWFGYAIATWSLPAFSFAFFTMCSIGPRAFHHHRFYLQKFEDYPRARKALIPFII